MALETELVFIADSGETTGMITSALEINPRICWRSPLGAVSHGHSRYAQKHPGGRIRGGAPGDVRRPLGSMNVMAVLALRVAHIGRWTVQQTVIPVSPLMIVP